MQFDSQAMLKVARGEPVAHVPVWCHRQAGRYLPEFLEEKAKVGGFFPLCESTEGASEVTIQPIRVSMAVALRRPSDTVQFRDSIPNLLVQSFSPTFSSSPKPWVWK